MTDATTDRIPGKLAPSGRNRRTRARVNTRAIVMGLYLVFLLLPIYWLLNMSLKTNFEILNSFTLWPRNLTLENYATILTDNMIGEGVQEGRLAGAMDLARHRP